MIRHLDAFCRNLFRKKQLDQELEELCNDVEPVAKEDLPVNSLAATLAFLYWERR